MTIYALLQIKSKNIGFYLFFFFLGELHMFLPKISFKIVSNNVFWLGYTFFFFIKKMETSLFLYDKKKQYKYAKKKEQKKKKVK